MAGCKHLSLGDSRKKGRVGSHRTGETQSEWNAYSLAECHDPLTWESHHLLNCTEVFRQRPASLSSQILSLSTISSLLEILMLEVIEMIRKNCTWWSCEATKLFCLLLPVVIQPQHIKPTLLRTSIISNLSRLEISPFLYKAN